jgi:uncharacterized membrane-anchored protein YhcB (DUF1043 family)
MILIWFAVGLIIGTTILQFLRNSAKPDSVKQAEWDAMIDARTRTKDGRKLSLEELAERNARNQR